MNNSMKDWAICTATVIAVVTDSQDPNSQLDGFESLLDSIQPSIRRRGRIDWKPMKQLSDGPAEISINVQYGPVLGGCPSDLRRWMKNAVARVGLTSTRIVVLFWNRRTLLRPADVIAACRDLQAVVDDPNASALSREWASRRLVKLMEHQHLTDSDLRRPDVQSDSLALPADTEIVN